jgi:hypothetical protein
VERGQCTSSVGSSMCLSQWLTEVLTSQKGEMLPFRYPFLLDIETQSRKFFAELNCQGEANIAQTNDAKACVFKIEH